MPQYGSNALRTDGTSFNVGNKLGDRPSIRLFDENDQNSGSAMHELLSGTDDDVQIFVAAPPRASMIEHTPAKHPSPPGSVRSFWSLKSSSKPVKGKPVLVGENLEWGKKRLHEGLLHGRVKDVRQAVEDGVDVNFRDAKGDTPLHHAARNGKIRMAQLLLDLGADATLENRSGERAAEVSSTGELIDLLYREPVKKPPRTRIGAHASEPHASESATERTATFDTARSEQAEHAPWLERFLANPVGFVCAHIHALSGKLAA